MSGGIEESFDIKKMSYKEKDNFWNILHQAYSKNSIMGCSINVFFIKIYKKIVLIDNSMN